MKINRLKRNCRAYRYFFKRFARIRLYYAKVFYLKYRGVVLGTAVISVLTAVLLLSDRSKAPIIITPADYAAALEKGVGLYEKELYEQAYAYLYPVHRSYPHAQYLLGMMHYNGLGVERDLKQAYENFKAAAETENEAKFMLAQMAFRGEAKGLRRGLPTNMLVESAYAGIAEAQSMLGVFYLLSGEIEQAYFWLALARRQGDEKAEKIIPTLETKLSESEKSLLDLEIAGFSVRK